jgi:hypothetical protein
MAAAMTIRRCPFCRLEYVPDSPNDRREHRRRHAEWMRPRRPQPNPRFAGSADVVVDQTSPKRLHKLVYPSTSVRGP